MEQMIKRDNPNGNETEDMDVKNRQEEINEKLNKNLEKGLKIIMNEITKYPKGSAEREKYIEYYKKVIKNSSS